MDELDEDRLHALIPRMRQFARALTRDATAADDLVQATLERALRAWSSRNKHDALQSWLFSILYRQFIDEQRRAKRWRRVLDVIGVADEPHAPSAERVNEGRDALAAFAELPDEQRAILLLVGVEGFSYREVADMLDVPIGTVMSRLSRARDKLRRLSEGRAPAPALRILK
ncbi:sigma-70 family RNA polymerase sigma factor [Lysobacter sp. F6437]|uniref:sigma-70 family RNA polymerase sigma factor n=1 Tax=Lysobacter sp. F6437 TaxID=3459296 RepID=UPI00403D7E78